MAKYRKKPVVIDAVQVPISADDTQGWIELAEHMERVVGPEPPTIETLEGVLVSEPGDWIIRGVKAEFYPVKPDVFAATYELVDVTFTAPAGAAGHRASGDPMITIFPSSTADTRTCDYANVSKETLLASSVQHIGDVRQALDFFRDKLNAAALDHDPDKITDIDGFHADFVTGFRQTGWWDRHRKLNRHHLTQEDGIPPDVNLIDVLDFIADCVMAGMARSGSVYPLHLSPELLERAFQNTAHLLKTQVVVVAEPVAHHPV